MATHRSTAVVPQGSAPFLATLLTSLHQGLSPVHLLGPAEVSASWDTALTPGPTSARPQGRRTRPRLDSRARLTCWALELPMASGSAAQIPSRRLLSVGLEALGMGRNLEPRLPGTHNVVLVTQPVQLVRGHRADMFSCCLPTSQGPGRGQPQAADILQSYRHWVSPRPQQLWQFSQRETKNDSDIATPLEDTSGVGTMVASRLEGEPSPRAADSAPVEPAPAKMAAAKMGPGPILEPEEPATVETVPSPSPASSVGTQEAGKVEKLVSQLVPAQQRGDHFIVPAFLLIYHKFTTTQQVLHLLFQRYASFQPHCEEDDRTKDALCCLLGTWLDRYPEHFCQPQDLTCLHQLLAYVQLHMPFSDLALRAQRLLTQLEDPEPKEAEAEPKDLAPTTAAAPQPESAEPSLPRAVHLSAAEALEAPEGPAAEPSAAPYQEQDVGTVPSLTAASRVGTLDTGMVEKLVNQLVPAQQRGDPFFVPTFLNIYQRFATTQQVLHLLFQRYASFQPHCEEDDRTKDALCSFLGTWRDRYPEHFCQPQDLASLNQLLAYVQLQMPSSDLARRAQLLLMQLEDPEPQEAEAEAEPEAPAPGGDLEVPPAAAAALLGSDLVATPASAPQPEPPEACLSLATVPAVDSLEPPASPEAKPEPEHPQPWFTKRRWPWGCRCGQRTISNQDRPHRRSPSWVRTLLSCFPIRSSGPRSGPSHE
ncbi:uncharacterized protein [Oryctolagus cuniculus]|uniref:uncharacterized protein n=1 Tax=Oryctolagus cuniculus TaxID=9986 RepID=UPI00387A313F